MGGSLTAQNAPPDDLWGPIGGAGAGAVSVGTAAPAPSASSDGLWGPIGGAAPAQVTPQSKGGVLQTAHDMAYSFAAGGVGLGKTGIGLLQLVARPDSDTTPTETRAKPTGLPVNIPGFTPPPEPIQPLGTTPQQLQAGQQIKAQEAASLLGAQQTLSGVQQRLAGKISPAGQANLNAPLNPFAKDSAWTHPLVQTALIKGANTLPTMLAALLPETFAAKIAVAAKGAQGLSLAGKAAAIAGPVAATGAAANAGLSAGSVMAAASDVVNQSSDADMRNPKSPLFNPAYTAMRQKGMPVDQAKAALVDKITGVLPLVAGAVGAMAGNISGGTISRLLSKGAGQGLLRRAADEGLANAAGGAAMMGSTTYAADQSAANLTGGKADWHDVLMESAKGAFVGMSMGSLVGALSRHAPETLAPGAAEHIASPEGAAVNAALHADMGTVPGAEPEPEPAGEPIDYDEQHGDEGEETEQPAPAQQTKPEQPAPPAAADEAQAAAIRAATGAEEAQPVAPTQAEASAAAPEPPKVAAPEPKAAPAPASRPYVMPNTPEERMPVASPAQVANATRSLRPLAQAVIARDPSIPKSDAGLVGTIMDDLLKQAHDELPFYEGNPQEMLRQFMAEKPLQQRVAEAVAGTRQVRAAHLDEPEPEEKAYGPEAIDPYETPGQTRVRAGDAYEPGNEAALLAKINPNEDNRTTYDRAEKMVTRRGDQVDPVYHDILNMRGQRGGDVRMRQLKLDRLRADERRYLKAEAAIAAGKKPPEEHELLQAETPPLTPESDQAFWARVERAHQRGEDAGTKMTPGTFLYRANKVLEDARDERGRNAVPNRALTAQMRGEEFVARHADTKPLSGKSKTVEQEIADQERAERNRLKDAGLDEGDSLRFKRDGAAEPLHVKSTAARTGQNKIKRGADAMTGRLRLAQGLDKNSGIDPGDIRDVEDFLHFLGPHLTKDTGLSVRRGPEGVLGSFDPHTRIVTIYKNALARGELTRTAVHELWHSVETALTLRDKVALRKEYARQYAKFLTKNPWMEAFGTATKDGMRGLKDSLTGQDAKDFLAKYGDNQSVMDQVKPMESRIDLIHNSANYRFVDWHEYFAETMTDKYFKAQDLQDERARSIVGHLRSFVQTIKSRIARLFGGDASGRIYEGFAQQKFSHRQEALDAYGAIQFSKVFGNKPSEINKVTDPTWFDPVAKSIRDAMNASNGVMNFTRDKLLAVASGQDIARAGEKLFDWTPKTKIATESAEGPSHTFQNAMSHMAHRAQTLSDVQTPLLRKVARYLKNPDEAARFADAMGHSTRFDYDPTRAPIPKSQPKSAAGIQRLERHREGYAAFKKLSPEGQVLFKQVRDAIRQTRVDAVRQLVRNNIEQVHLNNAREQIASGVPHTPLDHAGIDAQTDRYMNKTETEADKEQLGPTHDYLLKQRRIINGSENYFPERRHGKYAVVYKDLRPETHVFTNEADMQDFAKNTDLFIKSSKRTDYDANGDEVDKDDPAAQPVVRSEFTVNTQNHGLEFFDRVESALERQRELRNHPKNKYDVSGTDKTVEHTKSSKAVAKAMSPAMLETLRSALNKTAHDEAQKENMRQALNEAVIRLLPPNSMRAGALRRHNYMGASKDTMRTLYEHFTSAANIQSKLEYAREADNAIEAMKEFTDSKRYADDGMNHVRQEIISAVEKRRQSSPLDEPTSAKVPAAVRTAQQIAFVKFMATPSFNMIQAAQPYMTGLPYLAARHGRARSMAEMQRVMARIGGSSILAEGGKQVYSAMKNAITTDLRTPGDYMSIVAANMMRNAKSPAERAQAASEVAVLKRLADDGIVDHGAGLQVRQILNAAQTNPIVRGLQAAEEAARAMPTAVEVLNRSMLGIAMHRLEMAKHGDPERAYIAARTVIKETQGDYSPANTPLLMQGGRHPYLAPMFTFRKYAQMIYSLIGNHAYQALAGESKEVRQVARRTLGNTLAMHAMVAGMHGLPVGGIIMAAAIVGLALGEDKPWDYDAWAHQMLAHFMGPKAADTIINGLPIQAGFNVTKRMGLDSLLFDQLPKDNKLSSWLGEIGDTLLGAPGEMLGVIPQAAQDIRHGNYVSAASQLLPKVIVDPIKAANYYEHGVQDNYGDTIVGHLPLNQVIAQALGFEPDAVEEAYGARDTGLAAKDQYKQDRAAAMDSFSTAFKAGNLAAASQALARFNATVPYASHITFSQAMKATRSTNKNNEQIDGVGFTKKQQFLAAPMSAYNLPPS